VNEQHNAESQAITIAARKSAPNELKLGRSLSLKPEAHQQKSTFDAPREKDINLRPDPVAVHLSPGNDDHVGKCSRFALDTAPGPLGMHCNDFFASGSAR
jgi:hypothetical protein